MNTHSIHACPTCERTQCTHEPLARDTRHTCATHAWWPRGDWEQQAPPPPPAPTAGSAKKEMAKTEKQEAMVFPTHVWGTLSP